MNIFQIVKAKLSTDVTESQQHCYSGFQTLPDISYFNNGVRVFTPFVLEGQAFAGAERGKAWRALTFNVQGKRLIA
jgi:hypothetical protein